MTNLTISRRYAKALLALGKEDGNYAQYAEELNALLAVMDAHPEMISAVSNPLYPLESRKKAIQTVLERMNFAPVVHHFLFLLVQKNRMRYLKDIILVYQKLVDEVQNISSATIISAAELTDEVVEKIKKAVEKMTGKQVKLQVEVDPDMIGGIITKVGDMSFDGSVRTQLMSLRESLKRGE